MMNPLRLVSGLCLHPCPGLAITALCLRWFSRHRLTSADNGVLCLYSTGHVSDYQEKAVAEPRKCGGP